ncbi:4-hydroxybutyrate CoA-transferase [Sulfoacidibacillus thermotolerans]|uniref:4-hydroxybutyrate CoA-transferase n=2 Tax=Sulfoacidibacillus thermotolerans TaxID=1765684 RepID=A0A2U3DCV3_SULT2|nr:4-hydroxybutyrate CoA-transferase [Sulfoacidibacillus thermotolerans]
MISREAALAKLQSHQRIYVQGMASTPHGLLEELAQRGRELEAVELFHLHVEGDTPWITTDLSGHIYDRSLFIGKNMRDHVREGRASYVPLFLSEIPWFLSQPAFRPDVVFLNVSPPDAHGYVSLGPTLEATRTAIANAQVVIAQINKHVPRVLGDALIPMDHITYGVAWEEPLSAKEATEIDPVTEKIGYYVASLIENRSTLQLGIGNIPDAVLRQLVNHQDLGIHSEMISDGVQTLAEKGVITGRYKTTDPGKIVATFAFGTPELYRFLDDHPLISLRDVDYTNDTAVIRQNSRMVSINSAIEIDLTGQVVAESIGSQVISGVGGQMDFVRGASLSPEGKSIIALPSQTRSGQSRIVATLKPGAGVTTTRNHVQYVVTEYGIADLHGKSLEERARNLIAIAHPANREALIQAAKTMWKGF